MKILVPIKRVADPDNVNKVKIINDGLKVSTEGLEWKINPFDEYAFETALRLTENGETKQALGETIVVSIGSKEVEHQLRTCLAIGATKAILVSGEDEQMDSYVVAEILAKVYEKEKPDLIVMGKQAVDGDSNQVGQILAEKLGLPQATFASQIEMPKEGGCATVTRETDGGSTKEKVYFPSIITVDLRISSPKAVNNNITPSSKEYQEGLRLPSAKGIVMAKKKTIEQLTPDSLGVNIKTRVKYLRFEPPPVRKGGMVVGTVQDLVQKLHNEKKVI